MSRGTPRGDDKEGGKNMEAAVRTANVKRMDDDLRRMLSEWFSAGILELRRITYDDTPAAIIEKIARKEAVHPLRSVDDLRARLGPGRRCFAFFHPSLPGEPLVYVHVALMPKVAQTMEEIEELCSEPTRNTEGPQAAVFYSITSTQPGLGGVDLGNFLIKRVVEVLRSEFPGIETFSTLSPLPGFRRWLAERVVLAEESEQFADAGGAPLIDDIEREVLMAPLKCNSPLDVPAALLDALNGPWHREEGLSEALCPILMRLAARYLALEKRRGRPLDGVARFHVRNGAEMFRLNYLADTSRRGMRNGAGIMVNYRYRLDTIEENHAAYEAEGIVPVCEGISRWLNH
eukprot:CAMPEP_0183306328 /NCGR_PEP_ID=MMETSP0160_2-20130417/10783_1 /TAXON_ID=2839 ORGANISM="Odontella Sinensis, Strain Grunow 1884" /NCGR_SAMPLE_ID=MMETSP0160_2 /ASSEMBLY_ACC=CAM_ASM_000250 /LENGTH=345 /DNA_ID=CAMNT_0025469675 /DNA_START=41 /DNA_END=1078 /DNA_ORIENTATION=-